MSKTYDVVFNKGNRSNALGWEGSRENCKLYIRFFNGLNREYFPAYKGGTVSIVCNETDEVIYEEKVV